MHFLSIALIVLAGLAVVALFYELAGERKRAQIRERKQREFERINTPPPIRRDFRSHDR